MNFRISDVLYGGIIATIIGFSLTFAARAAEDPELVSPALDSLARIAAAQGSLP